MSVDLQPMRWWHIEPVRALERVLFVDDAWTDTMFWSELAERDTRTYVVAVVGDTVVGYAGLCAYSDDVSYIQTIGVTRDHQGRGVGTLLLVALLDEADARGSAHVDLEVRADNTSAISLYEKHGFASIGLRRGYYQPSGADAVVMRRSKP